MCAYAKRNEVNQQENLVREEIVCLKLFHNQGRWYRHQKNSFSNSCKFFEFSKLFFPRDQWIKMFPIHHIHSPRRFHIQPHPKSHSLLIHNHVKALLMIHLILRDFHEIELVRSHRDWNRAIANFACFMLMTTLVLWTCHSFSVLLLLKQTFPSPHSSSDFLLLFAKGQNQTNLFLIIYYWGKLIQQHESRYDGASGRKKEKENKRQWYCTTLNNRRKKCVRERKKNQWNESSGFNQQKPRPE